MDDHDVDGVDNAFWKMPDNMQALISQIGFPNFGDQMNADELRVYELARHGKCMTCEGPLEEHSNVIVNRSGIVGAYCGGQCHSDMAVLGYLQEQHDDIMTAVKFRGDIAADEASAEETGDDQD